MRRICSSKSGRAYDEIFYWRGVWRQHQISKPPHHARDVLPPGPTSSNRLLFPQLICTAPTALTVCQRSVAPLKKARSPCSKRVPRKRTGTCNGSALTAGRASGCSNYRKNRPANGRPRPRHVFKPPPLMLCANCIHPRHFGFLTFMVNFAGHDFYYCPHCRAVVYFPAAPYEPSFIDYAGE